MSLVRTSHQAVIRGAAILFFLLLAAAFSVEAASAQTGFTGIFGGGPFYKNAANNITEIEKFRFYRSHCLEHRGQQHRRLEF